MTEVVIQHLQLDRAPQPVPGAAVDTVYEAIPQLRKAGLYPLPHAAQQSASPALWRSTISNSHQQDICLFSEALCQRLPSVTQVGQHHSPFCHKAQGGRRVTIVPVAGRQDSTDNLSPPRDQHVQFEAEEPALAGLSEAGPILTQQSHLAITKRMAKRHRLAVNEIELISLRDVERDPAKQLPDHLLKRMQTPHPLLVGDNVWKGFMPVLPHQKIGPLERGAAQRALQQSDGNYFRVGEGRM